MSSYCYHLCEARTSLTSSLGTVLGHRKKKEKEKKKTHFKLYSYHVAEISKSKNKSEMKLEKGYFSINAISVPFYSKT